MKEIDISDYKSASVGENVSIICDELITEGAFVIKDHVEIKAKRVYLGKNAQIDSHVAIGALTGDMQSFFMGDETYLGPHTQVKVPEFHMGDYSRIFQHGLCSGYAPIQVGHNCWIGQNSILNSVCALTLGNNVRMGGNSQIWTHVASGELLEGSRFYSEKPVTLEDNVWLMGFGHTVSPGVVLARNTVVMSGSVVSKSTEAYHTYSGTPAVDVTEKLSAWNQVSLDDKYAMLQGFVSEFVELHPEDAHKVKCFDLSQEADAKAFDAMLNHVDSNLMFVKQIDRLSDYCNNHHTLFDLASKQYVKQRTALEVAWMKFSIGHRARFTPLLAIME